MKQFKLCSVAVFGSLLFFGSNAALAEFNVNQTSSSNEKITQQVDTGSYGNSQTTGFRKAMNANDEMSAAEQAAVAEKLPVKDTDVWYIRVRGYFDRDILSNISNQSSGSIAGSGVNEGSARSNIKGVEVAAGYIWDSYRLEGEYIFSQNAKYTPSPAFQGGSASLDATIESNTFLANMYYEFLQHERLKPYVFFGAGVSSNKSNARFNGASGDKRLFALAWSLGAGTRFKMMDKFYLDAAYRYTVLGKFGIENGAELKLRGTRSLNGPSIGFVFLI